MNIAIVGAGISGLVAAWHLRHRHSITLFEANDHVGGHANTVDVSVGDSTYSIDTGFIVYNDWTYPHYVQLLNELDVDTQPTEMSFSVCDPGSGLEYNGHSLNGLFAQRSNLLRPRFHRMVWDILRFNKQARRLIGDCDPLLTVAGFLEQNRYSADFRHSYLLPMGAAIWSCPPSGFAIFPMTFVAEFFNNHGLLNIRNRPTWRVIKGGSRSCVRKLTAGFRDRIRLSTAVDHVVRGAGQVDVQFGNGDTESFDHVVFGCHANQALAILGKGATEAERQILGTFPYNRNVAVLHTDTALLPVSRRAWASWNCRLPLDPSATACVTYNMNILQHIDSDQVFCVTLGGEEWIDRTKILKRFVYHHPIFTTQRAKAQSRQGELLCSNRSSFCGAYWRNGFHEDGVVSALAVVSAINGHGQSAGGTTRSVVESAR